MPAISQDVLAVNIGDALKLKPGVSISSPGSGYGSIGELISNILPNIYLISGLILFVLFIGGGFAIMTSGGNPDQQGKGAKAVTASVVGFLIIFVSYWIIQIIETITGVKIFNPGV